MFGLALLVASSVFAQQASTGSISGTVIDPSGQVIPGATVKITSELNRESRSGTTNETGDYFFGAVDPGVYTDGVNGGDGGGGGNFSGITSIDAIAEVNIQANSYTAEYGLKSGAQVNLVTKHGGSEFHGTAAYYKRHEQFNAQNFFNNRQGTN